MSTLGRPQKKLYTIDGEPGWSTAEAAYVACRRTKGLTYTMVSKRLQAGIDTWEGLCAPPRVIAHRDRESDPVPAWKRKAEPSLDELARRHAAQLAHDRLLLWLSWRGPVEQGQLVARLGP